MIPPSHQTELNGAAGRPRPPSSVHSYVPMILGGLTAILCVSALLLIWVGSQRIPALRDEDFELALQRWADQRWTDYEIEVEVTGRQAAVYTVQVRDQAPVWAKRNGYNLPQERIWKTWTVDGMFQTIRSDVRARQRRNSGDKTAPELLLRAEFDPELGVPRRYLRVEFGQPSEVSWRLTRLERLTPGEPSSSEVMSPDREATTPGKEN